MTDAPSAGAPGADGQPPAGGSDAAAAPTVVDGASGAPAGDLIGGQKAEAEAAPFTPFDPATFEYPEGLEVDDGQKEWLTKFSTDYKVPVEGIKALIDQHVQLSQAAADRLGGTLDNEWTSTVEGWRTEATKHYATEAALNDVISKCEGVIDEFGGPAIYEHLKTTGLANNLAFMQMFSAIAKAVGEGRPVPPAQNAQDTAPSLAALYPSMAKKD